VQVLDTAGIRETVDQVEKIGVERSRRAANAADLVLFTIDAAVGWTKEDQEIYQQVQHRPLILVINKIDLLESPSISLKYPANITQFVYTAAAQNQGIDALETAILQIVETGKVQAADLDLAINQRQAAALTKAKISLEQVQVTVTEQLPLDFWTIDLRGAIQALGEITGEQITESVLDRIFSRFCIGK
jgi:tRNA modification GTPase